MPDQSICHKVLTILECDAGCACGSQRIEALGKLYDQAPEKTQEVLVSLLGSSVQKVRRGAVSALLFFRHREVSLEPNTEALAEQLLHNPDERVRHSCAGLLLWVAGPAVARVFVAALGDASDEVVRMACWSVRHQGGTAGTQALYRMLGHPSWRVRLEACQALVDQKTTDARVVATLEAMSRAPEAASNDTEVDEYNEFADEFSKTFSPDRSLQVTWEKLGTLLNEARANATGEPPLEA